MDKSTKSRNARVLVSSFIAIFTLQQNSRELPYPTSAWKSCGYKCLPPPPPRGIYSHLHFKRAQGSALLLLIGLHRNLTYANSRIITFPATRNKRHRKTALWLCRSIRTKDSLDTCYGSFRCSKHSLLFMSFFARKSLYFFSTPPQKKVTINNR